MHRSNLLSQNNDGALGYVNRNLAVLTYGKGGVDTKILLVCELNKLGGGCTAKVKLVVLNLGSVRSGAPENKCALAIRIHVTVNHNVTMTGLELFLEGHVTHYLSKGVHVVPGVLLLAVTVDNAASTVLAYAVVVTAAAHVPVSLVNTGCGEEEVSTNHPHCLNLTAGVLAVAVAALLGEVVLIGIPTELGEPLRNLGRVG